MKWRIFQICQSKIIKMHFDKKWVMHNLAKMCSVNVKGKYKSSQHPMLIFTTSLKDTLFNLKK